MALRLRILLVTIAITTTGCPRSDANDALMDAAPDALADAGSDVDAASTTDAAEDAVSDAAALPLPQTCRDIQERAVDETGERPSDGTYTLYLYGDESQPWDVFCKDMQRAEPHEYLTVDEARNYSQWSDGEEIIETSYRRIRIDPLNLWLYPLDDIFSRTDSGDSLELPEDYASVPLGFAHYLAASSDAGGAAESRVDLSGTPFVLDESVLADGYFGIEIRAIDPKTGAQSADDADASDQSSFDIDSSLRSFTLTAENTDAHERSRAAADFENMLAAEPDVESVTIRLNYVGE